MRRTRLIEVLRSAGVPLAAVTGTREVSAEVYAESIASFNASLNGDLNMRVFEVLAAGGCLLTDRLALESGLGLLFDEGTHYFGYDSPEELIEKAGYLLQNPEQALTAARAGNAAFVQSMLPARRAADLLAWVFHDRLDNLYRVPAQVGPSEPTVALMDRLRIYEALQQVHLEKERPRILFDPAVPQIYRSDAADLLRLEVVVAPPSAAAGPWDAVVSSGRREIACIVSVPRIEHGAGA